MRSFSITPKRLGALGFILVLGVALSSSSLAQVPVGGAQQGIPWTGSKGITETVEQLMARENSTPQPEPGHPPRESKQEHAFPRPNMRLNPASPQISQWPPPQAEVMEASKGRSGGGGGPYLPQTVGTSFNGTTIAESGFIPPDPMGGVSPTQIVVAANGRLKVFNKNGSLGPLNIGMDTFFNSVRAGISTSDPRVKWDPTSQRWFIVCINVSTPNRVLLAVSSGATITGSGSFTFFFFQQDLVGTTPNADTGGLADYPTLGVDNSALYIGANIFFAGSPHSSCFVVRKSSILGAGPIVATAFRNVTGGGAGPFTPQGVDNFETSITTGYFIGVDVGVFGRLVLRRITNPGGAPTISGNLNLTVPSTVFPQSVPCLGSGTALDGLDDRLFAAQIKRNKITGDFSLWTAHNIEVNTAGVASGAGGRNGSRWYEIRNFTGAPALQQSGTVFHNAAANPDNYWIPTVAMSGQGHVAFGSSIAGTNRRAEIAVAGRLSSDPLGTMQAATIAQTSTSSYNLGGSPQRWGDYSMTVVDPADDMTMWTFQEYCNANNSWAVRVIQLKAPPPASVTSVSPNTIAQGASNVNLTVNGTSSSGSGFFDPGPGFTNRIAAAFSGTGITVNSITFVNPTQLTLNVSVSGGAATGTRNLTVTNPDGQTAVGNGVLTVTGTLPTITSISPDNKEALSGGFTLTVNGTNFNGTSVVRWNGSNRATSFVSATQLTATIPNSDIATVGAATVTVETPGVGISNGATFTINPIVVVPNAFSVPFGTHAAGNLASLSASDDDRLRVRWAIPPVRTDPLVVIELPTDTAASSASQLAFRLETMVDALPPNSITQQTQMFNYNTTAWETVDSRVCTGTDSVMNLNIASPARFVDPATGNLRVRLRYFFTLGVGTSSRNWSVFIDHAQWTVHP